jgi:hypothetical protein
MRVRQLAWAAATAATLLCAPAAAQVQRSFVASYGDDANTATNCGFANPCRGFTAAQSVTNSNGEIVALDSAGFGAIVIVKSISILSAPGAYAGISVGGGTAVSIATAGVKVRLSGLKLNATAAGGGVSMTNGSSLTIDNCAFTGFGTAINVSSAAQVRIADSLITNNVIGAVFAGGANVAIVNTRFLGNSNLGVWVAGTSATTTSVTVTDSVSSQSAGPGFIAESTASGASVFLAISNSSADNNNYGVISSTTTAGAAATVLLGSSKVSRNTTAGLVQSATGGTAVFRSAGNNVVGDNGANSQGTITNVGTM